MFFSSLSDTDLKTHSCTFKYDTIIDISDKKFLEKFDVKFLHFWDVMKL